MIAETLAVVLLLQRALRVKINARVAISVFAVIVVVVIKECRGKMLRKMHIQIWWGAS